MLSVSAPIASAAATSMSRLASNRASSASRELPNFKSSSCRWFSNSIAWRSLSVCALASCSAFTADANSNCSALTLLRYSCSPIRFCSLLYFSASICALITRCCSSRVAAPFFSSFSAICNCIASIASAYCFNKACCALVRSSAAFFAASASALAASSAALFRASSAAFIFAFFRSASAFSYPVNCPYISFSCVA